MNRKPVQRLWREEGLRVPQRKRKRRRLGDSTAGTAADRLRAERPNHVWAFDFQFDQTAGGRAFQGWCEDSKAATAYIDPGAPWQNPFVESFHSRLRDELLDVEEFAGLAEARVVIEDWREDYNTLRPHSSLGMRAPALFAAGWTAEDGTALAV